MSGRVNNYRGTYLLSNLERRLEHEGGDSRYY